MPLSTNHIANQDNPLTRKTVSLLKKSNFINSQAHLRCENCSKLSVKPMCFSNHQILTLAKLWLFGSTRKLVKTGGSSWLRQNLNHGARAINAALSPAAFSNPVFWLNFVVWFKVCHLLFYLCLS
jgi:hypothetical protein